MKKFINKINYWNDKIKNMSLKESLNFVIKMISGKKIFSTSFSIEDQIITFILNKINNKEVTVVTLDTGRLFNETYNTFHITQKNIKI